MTTQNPLVIKSVWIFMVAASFMYLAGIHVLALNNMWLPPESTNLVFDIQNPLDLSLTLVGILLLGVAYVVPKVFLNNPNHGFVNYILRLAICESVVVLGFVLAYSSQNPQKMYSFFIGGMLGFIFFRPTKDLGPDKKSDHLGLS